MNGHGPAPSATHVAIDMSATYRAAIRTGLPHATAVVDHFHAVQLANKMLSAVRRRTTAEIRGRRARVGAPEWKARRGLLRNRFAWARIDGRVSFTDVRIDGRPGSPGR